MFKLQCCFQNSLAFFFISLCQKGARIRDDIIRGTTERRSGKDKNFFIVNIPDIIWLHGRTEKFSFDVSFEKCNLLAHVN